MPVERSPDRTRSESTSDYPESKDMAPTSPQLATAAGGLGSGGVGSTINATYAVRLPPFWRDNPQLWFAQVEAAFSIVADIVTSPPDKEKYDAIKGRLVSVLGETTATRIRRLLATHELGDDKPSIFLQRLRNLAEGQVSDQILKSIFMERLPENIRAILAISEVTDLSKLAAQADKVMEVAKPFPGSIQAMSPKTGDNTSLVNKVSVDIVELTKQIAKLTKQVRSRSRSKSRGRRNFDRRPRSKSQARDNKELCYYHNKFGAQAYKCAPPCTWKKKTSTEN
ncbi:PREDICTED: uncharacterized protein LOC108758222 isoform X1 [Trachymyrmex cornetzi]|uniref:uncharacterized protein LOC108758222 isoform X1 n=1 Tax=Trachymyrmex cornetzi TaxID=471704 RepID=UPI00084F4043|nr:PREDICTED: uncharacterized protein LOC108758222 isoform X1 [Trachymyrmex cornetzi]